MRQACGVQLVLVALAGLCAGLLVGLVVGFRAGFVALRVAARVITTDRGEPARDDVQLAA
jgi:hypothetical protein